MGKFFNERINNNRSNLIKYGLIGAGCLIIFILIIVIATSGSKKEAKAQLKDELTIEINSSLPSKNDLFSVLENVDDNDITVDFDAIDLSQIGSYTVHSEVKNMGDGYTLVHVVDTTKPELSLVSSHTIKENETYNVNDFVTNCSDNSNTQCITEFYSLDTDSNGKVINYGAYTTAGTYIIKIVAKDESGNISEPVNSQLIIEKSQSVNPKPQTCKYGDLTVDSQYLDYPLGYIVGDKINNCSINKNLQKDDNLLNQVEQYYTKDFDNFNKEAKEKLKKEINSDVTVELKPTVFPLFNTNLKGLVGYSILMNVYLTTKDNPTPSEENLIAKYYLKTDSSRQYIVNKYNIS